MTKFKYLKENIEEMNDFKLVRDVYHKHNFALINLKFRISMERNYQLKRIADQLEKFMENKK